MDDDRLVRQLRLVDAPSTPSPAFVESLYTQLVGELGLVGGGRPATLPLGIRRRWRRRIGLMILAAAIMVGFGVVGSGLIGSPNSIQPTLSPSPKESASTAPTASPMPSASTAPTASPSVGALRGTGLVVFEHWNLPALGLTRLEYLAADSSGHELLPDVPGIQQTPVWSSDGTRLAFAGYDPAIAKGSSIWETDAQGSTPRSLTTDCTPPGCRGETDPAYSPDGRRLAFVRNEGPVDGSPATSVMAIRDLTSSSVLKLELTRVESSIAIPRHPRWSPDGTRLVFGTSTWATVDHEDISTISVIDADGDGLRQLVPTEVNAGDPSWSPDGTTILFSSRSIHTGLSDPALMQLYTVLPDGSGFRRLETGGGAGAASWSADGSQILYTAVAGFQPDAVPGLGGARPNMTVMERDGSGIRPMTAYGTCCRWYAVQQPTP